MVKSTMCYIMYSVDRLRINMFKSSENKNVKWMCQHTKFDRTRNKYIGDKLGVASMHGE